MKILISFLFAGLCCAQTAPVQAPPSTSLKAIFSDTENITLGAYMLSQIADSTSDWQFHLGGKMYNVSPVKRTAFAGATIGGALAVAHYFPRARKFVTVGLVVGSAILAGRAYAHTFDHGTPGALR